MTNLILLGGKSKKNEAWIRKVESKLQYSNIFTHVQSYKHWASTLDKSIDFDEEIYSLQHNAKNLDKYAFFAKSAGTIIALKAIYDLNLKPDFCILTGIPLKLIDELGLNLKDWIRYIKVPIIIIQNEHDPLGSYEQVESIFKKVTTRGFCKTVKLPGDTHDYNDFETFRHVLKSKLDSK